MKEKIKEYRQMPLDKLALMLASRHEEGASYILQQVEGWQRLRHKVPSWAKVEDLEYPPRLALEQCSGEAAALYKAQVVRALFAHENGLTKCMVDLTGGLGVDFSFVAREFDSAVYVERQEGLCELARHNFPLLGLKHAQVVCADGVDYLKNMTHGVDLIFLDPARRNAAGRKTVLIEDCEPDVCGLAETLLSHARYVVVKLSPMLDIAAAIRALGCVHQVHVVGHGGECKDLLLVLKQGTAHPRTFVCDNGSTFSFTAHDEATAMPQYAAQVGTYLYEPGAAAMKAGAFKWMGVHYGLKKLHPNSHLYTADVAVEGDFPGRAFKVEQVLGFGKDDVKQLRKVAPKANLTVRNFPATVDVLRKKLKIKEGGDKFIFATTTADNQHVMVVCRKK